MYCFDAKLFWFQVRIQENYLEEAGLPILDMFSITMDLLPLGFPLTPAPSLACFSSSSSSNWSLLKSSSSTFSMAAKDLLRAFSLFAMLTSVSGVSGMMVTSPFLAFLVGLLALECDTGPGERDWLRRDLVAAEQTIVDWRFDLNEWLHKHLQVHFPPLDKNVLPAMLNLFRSLLNKRGEGRGSPFSPLLRHRSAPALRLQWFWNLWRRKVVSSDKSVQAITSNPAEFHSQCQNVECCEIYGSFVRLNHFPFLLNLTNIQHISVVSIQELTASGQKSSVYNCVYSSAFGCISSDQIHRMPVENHCIRIYFCT